MKEDYKWVVGAVLFGYVLGFLATPWCISTRFPLYRKYAMWVIDLLAP